MRRLWQFILGLFSKKAPEKKKRAKPASTWIDGNYATARALLDDLQNRADWLNGFRGSMKDTGMAIIKRQGIYMQPLDSDDSVFHFKELVNEDYPAVFAVAVNGKMDILEAHTEDGETLRIGERLFFAERFKWSAKHFHVERPKTGYFYSYSEIGKNGKKYYYLTGCIEIIEGKVRTLRVKENKTISLPHGQQYNKITWAAAGKDVAEDFIFAYNVNARRDASDQVFATKSGMTMAFTVPMHRQKDFFKDRDKVKTRNGKTKRIFHYVRAHKRRTGANVKMHTRGVRDFIWNGFDVEIREWKPGRTSLNKFGLVPMIGDPKEDGFIGVEELAKELDFIKAA